MSENSFPEATLCWILKDGKALLKFANRGISKGKWNAVGGSIEPGESPLECVKRETFEETGLRVEEAFYHGKFKFFFGDNTQTKTAKGGVVHVFSSKKVKGELKESDEGEVKWFDLKEIPFDQMWEDDKHWVPLMLAEKRFDGELFFNEDGSKLISHKLHVKG